MRSRLSGAVGLVIAVLSAAAFGISGTFASSLIAVGWTPAAAVTARITIGTLILTIPALIQLRGRWVLLRRSWGKITAFGLIAVAGCQLCYFNAITHVSVGVALLLEYLGVILVVGWLWLRRGQRPRALTIAGSIASVLGLLFVLDLGGSHRLDPVGVLWGLGAAVGLAVYFVLSDGDGESVPPLVMAWGGLGVGAVALIVLELCGVLTVTAPMTDVVLLNHRVSWLVPVLGLALIASAFAYVLGITGTRLLGSKTASFVGLTEVLFAVAFAWLFVGQVPVVVQFIGGALILGGVTLIRVDDLRAPPGAERRASAELSDATADPLP
jgi:drug/metabolite transporter (DMT)-like permease